MKLAIGAIRSSGSLADARVAYMHSSLARSLAGPSATAPNASDRSSAQVESPSIIIYGVGRERERGVGLYWIVCRSCDFAKHLTDIIYVCTFAGLPHTYIYRD